MFCSPVILERVTTSGPPFAESDEGEIWGRVANFDAHIERIIVEVGGMETEKYEKMLDRCLHKEKPEASETARVCQLIVCSFG
jgi:hypothetical protein